MRHDLVLVALLAATAAGCGDRPDDGDARLPPADSVSRPVPDTATPRPAADGDAVPFDAPVMVYFEAGTGAIERAGAGMAAEDFSAMADELMFYRASALSILERQPVRLVRLDGRRPLRFIVDGAPRWYDFADRRPLDLVVLYRPDDEPRTLGTVDVSADPGMVSRFFEEAATP